MVLTNSKGKCYFFALPHSHTGQVPAESQFGALVVGSNFEGRICHFGLHMKLAEHRSWFIDEFKKTKPGFLKHGTCSNCAKDQDIVMEVTVGVPKQAKHKIDAKKYFVLNFCCMDCFEEYCKSNATDRKWRELVHSKIEPKKGKK